MPHIEPKSEIREAEGNEDGYRKDWYLWIDDFKIRGIKYESDSGSNEAWKFLRQSFDDLREYFGSLEPLGRVTCELPTWELHNFGDQPQENALLGMCEEVGELCQAHLFETIQKSDVIRDPDTYELLLSAQMYLGAIMHNLLKERQGIRRQDHKQAVQDNILKLNHSLNEFTINYGVSNQSKGPIVVLPPKDTKGDCIADLMVYSVNYCIKNDPPIDASQELTDCWAAVSQRDFKKFPKNGVDE